MQPNLHTGERVVSEQVTYYFSDPKRGDIVVIKSPADPAVHFIKRVIGLPGETITVSNGSVLINGQPLDERYANSRTDTSTGHFLIEGQSFKIPDDNYFVLGDNRDHSSDSRAFGPITKDKIVGHAVVRYWPLDAATIFHQPAY